MVRRYLHQYPLPRHLLNSDITSSMHNQTSNTTTTTTTIPTGKPGDDPSFDSNMVIILAGLLCALICALGLNSIVRCALRCSRRFPYEISEGRRLGSKGVTKDDLRRIPVVAYETGINAKSATDCAICLTEFEDGERVRVLPDCDHGFHVLCIDKWLRSHSSCPNCRQPLSHHSATKQSSS